ncbi:MAG: beta-lactamase family protein [Defluviitaleaceae bacterium]|nr:beta-lactamase family protein [Defluviitaleaceae bacterium]
MQPENLMSASPESLGIPSSAIEAFIADIEDKRLCLHSFLLLRHGKVAAEGYWPHFDENFKHRMYSISKSFTSIAIGMMIEECKIALDSKAADFFPEHVPVGAHKYTLEATIRDLLMMATQNRRNSYNFNSSDFTETFFTDDGPKHKPGQIFHYDTAATTVLCAIVEKLSGKTVLEYMRPVLDEIGFSKDAYCVETPEGRSWTGSGILCTSRDLARFALLCMNGGQWNGRQLLNQDYVKEATSWQIDTSVSASGVENRSGYGYQIWILRKGGFAFYGMGSQYALCMPHNGTILITNADTQGADSAGDVLFDAYYRMLDKISPNPLPEDQNAQKSLSQRISKLSLPHPQGNKISALAGAISGRKYMLDKNEAGMKWLRLNIDGSKCHMQYENESGEHELIFGMDDYEPQLFPEKYYGRRIGIKDTHYKSIGAGAWPEDKTFIGTIYAIDDYLGSINLQLTFVGNEVCGYMKKAAEAFFDQYQGFLSGTVEE